MIVGPFWAQMPSTSTMYQSWAWLWLWFDDQGRVVARAYQEVK